MKIDTKAGLIGVVAATIVVRLWVAVSFPVLNEEAYYWGLSQHPGFGFLHTPPMVAWMIAAFDWLAAYQQELGLRMASLVCGVATLALVHLLAKRLFSDRHVARLSLLLACALPLFGGAGVLMVPDAPGVTFSLAATVFFWAAVTRQRTLDWVACGAAFGLAVISKLGVLLVLPAYGIFLATSTAHRATLRRAGPYLAALAAVAVALPFLLWNADHAWATFVYEIRQRAFFGSQFQPMKVPEVFLEQALSCGLLLFVPVVAFLFAPTGTVPARWREPFHFLKIQAGVEFGSIVAIAPFLEVHPQDQLPAYPSIAVGIAAILATTPKQQVWRYARRAIAPCIAISLGTGVVAATGQSALSRLDASGLGKTLGNKIALVQLRLYSWPDLGRSLSARLQDFPDAETGAFFTCQERHAASLAFYHRGEPVIDVMAITLRGKVEGPALLADADLQALDGLDGLYFCSSREVGMGNLHEIFGSITKLDPIDVRYRGAVVGQFEVYRATDLRLKGFVPKR